MFGEFFVYDGKSSADYDLVIGGFGSDDIEMGLSRNILKGEQNKFRPVPNHMGTVYSDVLKFQVSLIKNPCGDNPVFSEDEVEEINAWLTSPDYPLLFHTYGDEDNNLKYDYYGIFSDVDAETFGGKVIGLNYEFTTNAPYAWSNLIEKTFDCAGSTVINIDVQNDDRRQFIYPMIKIKGVGEIGSGNGTHIVIKNETDGGRELKIDSNRLAEITIDSGKSKIMDRAKLLSFEELGIGDIDYIYWPRLYNGRNKLIITGDAEITFSYREPRKVGAY